MMKTAIFVLYHKKAPLFETEIYHPLQTGAATATEDIGILRDDTGDNISAKNPHYGELSGWYWVWKNWLPAHPEIDRVGFCHYRRFLDPFEKPNSKFPFHPILESDFAETFRKWKDGDVDRIYHSADLFLSKPRDLRKSILYDRRHETVYSQYAKAHPVPDMDAFLEMLVKESESAAAATKKVFNGHVLRDCLMFVMKRDLFENLAEWTFRLLFELESKTDWSKYSSYMTIRAPAYIMERAYNVWLETLPSIAIEERDSVLLVGRKPTAFALVRKRLHFFRHPPTDATLIKIPDCIRQ